MTILFAGGEMGSFIPADGNCREQTTSAYYDSAFARASINLSGAVTYAQSFEWTEEADCWIHADLYVDGVSGGSEFTLLTAYNASDIAVYQLRGTYATNLTIKQYTSPDGSAWTQRGTSFTTSIDTRNTFDIHVHSDASGSATVYVSGTERLTASADLSGLDGIAYIRLSGSLRTHWSQIIVSDESTIGKRLKTVPATGAGATTTWIGTYAEIDEAVYADVDFINSASADEVELFAHSSTVSGGYSVQAVVVTARAKRGASGPQNLQLALRSGGTTYFTASQALGLGYGAHVGIWEDDPATAAAFTTSAITTAQFGVKSIT